MKKNVIEPKLITVQDAAAMLGLSVWTLRNWCYRGLVSSNKLGSRRMLPTTEVDRIIAETRRPRLEPR
jgi:excisionase family DNA binding protein